MKTVKREFLLLKAIDFAAEKHRFQKRKDEKATPYLNHVIKVAKTLAEAGEEDVDLLTAAILHDTIEDTETTADELIIEFGKQITALVVEMTDDKLLSFEKRKELQIIHAAAKSTDARKLKLADKICNVEDVLNHPPHGWSETRRYEYILWANRVVDEIRGTQPILEKQFDDLFHKAEIAFRHLHTHNIPPTS